LKSPFPTRGAAIANWRATATVPRIYRSRCKIGGKGVPGPHGEQKDDHFSEENGRCPSGQQFHLYFPEIREDMISTPDLEQIEGHTFRLSEAGLSLVFSLED
jgi:hypothetical protein